MPMHMSIPLLASKRENVDPLRRKRVSDGLSHAINEPLKCKIFFQCKVTSRLLTVRSRSNQYVAQESRVFVEENHSGLILINEMVAIVIVASKHHTDETGTF